MSDPEKNSYQDTSSNPEVSHVQELADPDAGKTPEERAEIERKLLWKLDLRLIPWLSLLYLLCFLDRSNIGNAKVAHLTDDVPMTTHEYNATLTIFFVGYAIFEALANVLLKKTKPSIFIPIIMILWGACMVGMGFVHNWSGLMAGRWFLGVTEAGLFPGVNYYLSCWYRRNEFGVRAAIFFSAAALAGSFGGLLAAAIQNMHGVSGLAGWQWIFVLEGLVTVLIGGASFWMVHDFPDEARFLSEEDRARVLWRLKQDQQSSAEHEEFEMGHVWAAVKDWKTYAGMLIYMGSLMPLYSFSLFLPTIIQNMSFTTADAVVRNQLLSVPPYALAAIVTVVVGFWSDRSGRRAIFNICCAPIALTGFIMLIATDKAGVQYAGVFLGAAGIYPAISLTIAWVANNVEGVYKRGIVLGAVIGWGNMNGVVSSNIYFNAPRFYEGHGVIIAYLFVSMFLGSILYAFFLSRENKARREGRRDHLVAGKTAREIQAMGDGRPDFIYTI
ncbi:Major Facilitator Superfamily [Geosmithia morbida]|uniref:Major Facilitator Superfamily n=1 Tax=Geosmithia morbida TaxID=1094350 RepID=A0A9P4Z321_9HYPO|nr:Major Facilitator Superfamily [Geosmithia morbida]KAF4126519.1 Major Facilitator Superfamily [Geosmithia morbida]